MQTKSSKFDQRLEQAHELLRAGQREEARQIAEEILKLEPANMMARALRDRIDNEDFSQAIVRERQQRQSLFEIEDVSPLVLAALVLIGIACFTVGTYLGFRPFRLGLAQGFSTPVPVDSRGVVPGRATYPLHLFLLYPTVLYILGAFSFYAVYRYTRK
jgi:hypothetical protein